MDWFLYNSDLRHERVNMNDLYHFPFVLREKKQLLVLFLLIWIKRHFPLVSPLCYFT